MSNNISDSFINKKRLSLIETLCGSDELDNIKNLLNECFDNIISNKSTSTYKLLSFISSLDNIHTLDDSNKNLYHNTNRKEYIINNDNDLKKIIPLINKSKILGFDTEQKPVFKKGVPESKIAIIQLCDANNSYIFQVQKIKNISSLLMILSNKNIIKVGIGLKNDLQVLYKEFNCRMNACIDFGILFKDKLFSPNELGAKKACLLFLDLKLQKSKNIARSNWERDVLSEAQIKYANEDASCVYDSFCMMILRYEFLLEILPLWFQEKHKNNDYKNILNDFSKKFS